MPLLNTSTVKAEKSDLELKINRNFRPLYLQLDSNRRFQFF